MQSQSCPKNNMGASQGFFGRVRPTFPWARGWSAGVRVGPPCLGRVWGPGAWQPGRRSEALPGCRRAVEPGRLGVGPSSQTRPTRNGTVEPGRLGMPVDGQTRPTTSVPVTRRGRERGSRARPTRSASGAAVTESPSRSRPTRSEAVERWAGALPTRSGVEPTEGLGFRVCLAVINVRL